MSAFNNNLNNATGASNGLHNQQQPGQLNDNGLNNQGLNTNQYGSSNGLNNQQPGQLTNNDLNNQQGSLNSNQYGTSTGHSDGLHNSSDINNSTGLHNQHGLTNQHQPGQLNENHGIAASGHNDNNLKYSGVPISNVSVDQQNSQGIGITGNNQHHDGLGHNGGHSHSQLNNDNRHTGVPDNNHHTGNAFAGTTATLGSTSQPMTSSHTADNLAHTGQPKTYGAIDDLASTHTHNNTNEHHHPGVATGAAATGAAALGSHEYNKHNGPGSNSGLSNNHLNNEQHHTTGSLGDREQYKLNDNGLNNSGHSNNHLNNEQHHTTGALGDRGQYKLNDDGHNNHGLNNNERDHHHAGVAGTGAAGAAALGSHEHNKHNNATNDHHVAGTGVGSTGASALGAKEHNKHANLNDTNVQHAGGASATKGDHGFSNHNKQSIEEPGIHDSRGVRHAGIPLQGGLAPIADKNTSHNDEHTLNETDDTKATAGDKIKGNFEKMIGKVTGNEAKVIKGDNIAHGNAV